MKARIDKSTGVNETTWQLEATNPLFSPGDRVIIMTTGDEVYISAGIVMGVEWCPIESYIQGWWYSVQCLEGDGKGLRDFAPEEELVNLAYRFPQGCTSTSGESNPRNS